MSDTVTNESRTYAFGDQANGHTFTSLGWVPDSDLAPAKKSQEQSLDWLGFPHRATLWTIVAVGVVVIAGALFGLASVAGDVRPASASASQPADSISEQRIKDHAWTIYNRSNVRYGSWGGQSHIIASANSGILMGWLRGTVPYGDQNAVVEQIIVLWKAEHPNGANLSYNNGYWKTNSYINR